MSVVSEFIGGLGDPEALLRHFYVVVGASTSEAPPNGQAPVRRFLVDDQELQAKGFTTGFKGWRGVTKSRPVVGITLVNGAPKGPPAANEFDAYYVPMVDTYNVTQRHGHYTLPSEGLPELVITPQLNGGSFGVGVGDQGETIVAHVQPNYEIGAELGVFGLELRATNLAGVINGGFREPRGIFTLGQQYQSRGTVIGRLSKGQWAFYLQAISGGNARTVTRIARI